MQGNSWPRCTQGSRVRCRDESSSAIDPTSGQTVSSCSRINSPGAIRFAARVEHLCKREAQWEKEMRVKLFVGERVDGVALRGSKRRVRRAGNCPGNGQQNRAHNPPAFDYDL